MAIECSIMKTIRKNNPSHLSWQLTFTREGGPSDPSLLSCWMRRVAFSPALPPSILPLHWFNHNVSYFSRAVARRLYSLQTCRDSYSEVIIVCSMPNVYVKQQKGLNVYQTCTTHPHASTDQNSDTCGTNNVAKSLL